MNYWLLSLRALLQEKDGGGEGEIGKSFGE